MSTLNKAFIKAYQRRGASGPHIPLPAAPPSVAMTSDDLPVAVAAQIADGNSDPGLSVSSTEAMDTQDSQDISQVTLEAESASRESVSSIGSNDEEAPLANLRPAFEVERLDWPGTVRSLLESKPELTTLTNELLPSGCGTIVVTGCRRGEGRTSVALMLARHLARGGVRVALVDADFQRPQVADSLGIMVEAGWEESLAGETLPDEAAIESLADGLTIVPLRRPISASVLSEKREPFRQLIERWQTEFDIVCLDAGPLAESGDAGQEILFDEAQIEAAVVVRDVRHCRLEQAHAVGRKLAQLGVSRWAIIENFCGDPCTKPTGS
jgi:Mrp family chromosome partitioning ATPase